MLVVFDVGVAEKWWVLSELNKPFCIFKICEKRTEEKDIRRGYYRVLSVPYFDAYSLIKVENRKELIDFLKESRKVNIQIRVVSYYRTDRVDYDIYIFEGHTKDLLYFILIYEGKSFRCKCRGILPSVFEKYIAEKVEEVYESEYEGKNIEDEFIKLYYEGLPVFPLKKFKEFNTFYEFLMEIVNRQYRILKDQINKGVISKMFSKKLEEDYKITVKSLEELKGKY